MRRCCLCSFLVPPGFNHNNRFCTRERFGRTHELPCISNRLDIEHNTAGVNIHPKVINQITKIDIEHRTDRDKRAEPDFCSRSPVQDRPTDRTTLRQQRDRPLLRHGASKGRIQIQKWHDESDTVRTDDTQPIFFLQLKESLFSSNTFRSDFLKSR